MRSIYAALFAVAALLAVNFEAQATNYTFSAVTGAWSEPGNWSAPGMPPIGGETDAIILLPPGGGTGDSTNDLPGIFVLNRIGNPSANTVNVYGNPLYFTISSGAVMPMITNNSGGSSFNLNNNIILSTNLTLTGSPLNLYGNISETAESGLIKSGSSTATIYGTTNTFTGKTIILAGTLTVTSKISSNGVAGSLGAPTGANAIIDIYSGATLYISSTGDFSTDRGLNLAGGSGTVSLYNRNNGQVVIFNGAVTVSGTGLKTLWIYNGTGGAPGGDSNCVIFNEEIPDVADGSALSFRVTYNTQTASQSYVSLVKGGTFTGPITLTRANGTILYLTIGGRYDNDYGAITSIVGSGTLCNGNYTNTISMDNYCILNYKSSANQKLSGKISGAGGLNVSGHGTLTLTASNTYTDVTTLNSGALVLDFVNVGSGAVLANSTLTNTLSGGTLLVKCKSGPYTAAQAAGDVSVGTGGGAVLGDVNGGNSVTITLGALPNVTAAGSSFLAGTAGANTNGLSITTTGGGTLSNGMFNGREVWCSSTNSGYDWLTQTNGPVTYTLCGLDSGTLAELPTSGGSSTENYKMTTGKTLGSGVSVSTLKLEAPSGALDLAGNTLTISGNGLLCTGSTNVNITGSAATGLSAAGELVVHQYNTGGLTVFATIGSGTVLTKAGSGVLTLMTNNTLGTTYINGGTIEVGGNGRLSSGSHNQTIVFSGNSSGLLKYNSSASQALNGVISGGGGITLCSGTLTLTNNANTFTKPFTVQAGTLSVPTINNANANGPLGNSSYAVIMGYADGSIGTLQLTRNNNATSTKPFTLATGGGGIFNIVNSVTQTITGVVSGGGSLTKTGPGALVLSGSNTLSGDITVVTGKLSIANACLSSGSTVTLGSGATLDLNFAGTNVIHMLVVNGQTKSADLYSSGSGVQITGSGVLRSLFPVSGTVITVR